MKQRPPITPYLTRRSFLKLFGGTTATALLSACATADPLVTPQQEMGSVHIPTEPQHGGVLRMALFEALSTFDPARLFLISDWHTALAIYEGLTWIDADGILHPVLATVWEQADDLLSWTFTLREGVTFQHGTSFTAEDVVFTFERLRNPDVESTFAAGIGFIERLEAVDDFTVRFHLNSPNVDLAYILASPQAVILPRDRSEAQITTEPLGTGPFRLSEHQPGERVILTRNEDYWQDGLPYLDGLQFIVMTDSTAQVDALTNGTVDVLEAVNFEYIPALEDEATTLVLEVPGGSRQYIVMQVTEPPFDDVRVRQALKHCIDRERVIQTLLQGRGVVGNDQPIAPISPFWADLPAFEYNTDKAQALLTEAGYPNGLSLTLYTSPINPRMVDLAVALREMAKPAGITIEIVQISPDIFWSDYFGKVPFFTSDLFVLESDDVILTLAHYSEGFFNVSRYHNPELDALIEQARAEPEGVQRAVLYAQIQQIIRDNGGMIIPYFVPVVAAARTNVHNIYPTPRRWILFHEVWLREA